MENTIKTIQGPEIKISWNMIDCPYRSNCEDREEREKKLFMHRCRFNPSMLECETYQTKNLHSGASIDNVMNLWGL